jgi:hypothetical protein
MFEAVGYDFKKKQKKQWGYSISGYERNYLLVPYSMI